MYTLNELKKQNQEITDLIEVIDTIIKNKKLISNPFVCELVSRFNEKVWMHLVFEDNTIYSELAKHHNPDISDIAKQFHDSAKEIKKDFTAYVKLWCETSGADHQHLAFCDNTTKILQKIKRRIQFETDKIFPLIEQ